MKLGIHNLTLCEPPNGVAIDFDDANAPLRLNHYDTQSRAYFQNVKMKRGDVNHAHHEKMRTWDYFDEYDVNDAEDYELSDKRRGNSAWASAPCLK